MTTSVYPIHRAINRPIRFKRLTGQYILVAAAGLIGDVFLFIILYGCHCPAWIDVPLALCLGAAILAACRTLSRKYGIHGLRKAQARRHLPPCIRCRSRNSFTIKRTAL
jgi:hypothetical protein